jgi:hypothetical protein
VRPGPFGRLVAVSYPVRVSGDVELVSIQESSAAVRVRVSDRERVGDLKAFLEAAGCSVREVGNVTLDVEIDRAPSDSQASREITIYLKTWQAMHPETHARVVREDEAG